MASMPLMAHSALCLPPIQLHSTLLGICSTVHVGMSASASKLQCTRVMEHILLLHAHDNERGS